MEETKRKFVHPVAIGDRVRVIHHRYQSHPKIGDEGTITQVSIGYSSEYFFLNGTRADMVSIDFGYCKVERWFIFIGELEVIKKEDPLTAEEIRSAEKMKTHHELAEFLGF